MADLKITGEVVVSAENAESTFNRLGDKADQMAGQIAGAARKAGTEVDKIGDGAGSSAEKFTRSESRISESIKRTTRNIEQLGKTASQKLELQIADKGLDPSKFEPLLRKLRETEAAQLALAKASATAGMSAAKAANEFSLFSGVIGVAFGAASLAAVGKLVSVQREFDVLNSSLKTVTGSSAAAERELAWLKDFAKETPFGLAQATQGFVKMKALGLDPTKDALTSFGNTASALGKDLNQMIEAVADASTGEFERLKEFGIKAKKEGDNVSLTFQGLTKTIGNSAAEITKYLENIGNTSFGGAMAERAKTLDGAISGLGDTWDELFRTVSTNNAGGLIFDSVKLANGAIEDATTLIKAMSAAANENASATGAMAAIQGGLATVFETVAVLGTNVKYVLVQVGNEVGGMAAQIAALARLDFDGFKAIRESMVVNSAATRKQVDETSARILGARKAAQELVEYTTRNASAAFDPRRIDASKAITSTRPSGGAGGGKSDAAKAESEYTKLIQTIKDKIAVTNLEISGGQKLNDAEKMRVDITGKLDAGLLKLTDTQKKRALADIDALDVNLKLIEAQKEAMKVAVALQQVKQKESDAIEDYMRAQEQAQIATVKAANESVVSAQAEFDSYGKTKSQIAQVTLARLNDKLAAVNAGSDIAKSFEAQITAQKQIIGILSSGEARDISEKAAKDAADDWKKTAESIQTSLTDALLRGFESGKGFGKNLLDTLKNMFKTLVLRPTINAIVNPIAGAITSSLGMAGAANAATGGGAGGLMGAASTLSSIGSGINMLTGGITAGVGSAFATGFTTAAAGLTPLVTTSVATGLAATTSTLAGLSGTLGTALGAIGPVGWAALAAIAAVAIFSKNGTPSGSTGSLERTYSAAGAVTSERSPFAAGNGAQMIDGLYARFTGLQNLLQAKGGASFGYGAYSGNDGKNPMGRISGGTFNSGEIPTAELGLAASRAILSALQASEMPKGIKAIINSLDVSKASEEQIQALQTNAVAYAQTIKALSASFDSLPFANLKGMAFEAADALVVASGGLESFSNSLKSYYENFYTAEEKRVQTIAEITSKLNAAGAGLTTDQVGGMSRADFRVKFEAAGNSPELNAALLSVAGAFASITPEATAAAASITAVSTAISDTMKGLLKDREALVADVLQAQGNTGGADAARRAIAITGFSEAETAAYDYNQALREEIKTRQDATAALATSQAAALAASQAVAGERKGLQDQLNGLTDTAAQALNRQRDALNESNQALFDQVQTAQEAKTANVALAQSQQAQADAAKAAAEKLAGINGGLEERLDLLTGAQTQRSIELSAATDDSTKSLLKQIYAQEDLKTANDAMAQAADGAAQALVTASQRIVDQRRSLEQQLFDLTATDAQKSDKARQEIDPANLDVYDKLVSVQKAAKDATDAATRATELATAAAAAFATQMGRFGSSFNLRFDLTTASGALSRSINTALTTVMDNAAKTAANFKALGAAEAAAKLVNPGYEGTFSPSVVTTQLTQNSLTVTNKAIESARNLRGFFTGMVTEATKLEKEISDANTTIGKGVQAINVAKYFTDFAGDLNTAFGAIKTAFGAGADTLADSKNILDIATAGLVKGSGQTTQYVQDLLTSIGANLTAFDATGLEALVGSVGGGATKIGTAITRSILDSISTSIKDNPAFRDLSTSSLAYVGAVVGGVGKGDIQGINDAFVLLSGALSIGKINATQYDSAINLVTDAFAKGADAAGTAAESIDAAYKRLRDVIKTNEQIAQEKISLEDRLSVATDTTAQALARARNAIDPYNQSLFDTVTAAENAKVAAANIAQERSGLQDRLNTATDTTAQAMTRVRNAIDPLNRALFDSVTAAEAAKAAQVAAAEASKAALDKAVNAVSESFNQVTKAANAQKTAISAVYEALTKGINEQLSTVGTSISKLQGLSSKLSSTLDGMKISGSEGANRIDGQQTIAAILASVQAGGALPVDSRELENALSAVSKPSEQLFSSFEDYAKDFYKTANDIAGLGVLTEKELTAQQVQQATLTAQLAISKASYESQLKQIDDALAMAQAQLDAFQGNTNAILSLGDAMVLLSADIRAATNAQAAAAVAATAAATLQANEALFVVATAAGVAANAAYQAEVMASIKTRPVDTPTPERSYGSNESVFDASRFRNESGGSGEMITELRAVKQELAQLNAAQEQNNEDTRRAADRLDGRQGTPFLVQVAV